jgi:hypothetical protein
VTKAVYGVAEVKSMKSRGTCAVTVEIPIEFFRAAAWDFHDRPVLVTIAEVAKEVPYGILESQS